MIKTSFPESMEHTLPFAMDWLEYKGEIYVGQVNWQRSIEARKPMIDLSYCMTKALNQCVIKTVQYDRSKFKPCHLTSYWEDKKYNPA